MHASAGFGPINDPRKTHKLHLVYTKHTHTHTHTHTHKHTHTRTTKDPYYDLCDVYIDCPKIVALCELTLRKYNRCHAYTRYIMMHITHTCTTHTHALQWNVIGINPSSHTPPPSVPCWPTLLPPGHSSQSLCEDDEHSAGQMPLWGHGWTT